MGQSKAEIMRRYRQRHRGFDWFTSREIAAIVEQHRAAGLDPTLSGTIDALVLAGHQAISRNRPQPKQ